MPAKPQKLLVFGDDNGSCSLYAMSKEEYQDWASRYADTETDEADDKLWAELENKRIDVTAHEYGYIPDYVVELAKIYGFEVDSN